MKRALSALLVVFLLSSLAACAAPTTPAQAPTVQPKASAAQTTAQGSGYQALVCNEQDFSVLYRSDFTGKSGQNGATIDTAGKGAYGRVDIAVLHNGDTAGFDVSEYFSYRAEDMGSKDGNTYTLCEEMTQSTFGNVTLSGAVYSFLAEDGTVYRYEMLADTGTQLIGYSCYFLRARLTRRFSQ